MFFVLLVVLLLPYEVLLVETAFVVGTVVAGAAVVNSVAVSVATASSGVASLTVAILAVAAVVSAGSATDEVSDFWQAVIAAANKATIMIADSFFNMVLPPICFVEQKITHNS